MSKKCNVKSLNGKIPANPKIVAFIPARGGSKSIPLKNIRTFCGRPLLYWVVKAACDCDLIAEVWVATDDARIKRTVEGFLLPKVKLAERSSATATDQAATELAMLEFAQQKDFEHILLIQATSPLLDTVDLTNGINKYLTSKAESLLSVVRQKRFIWEYKDSYAIPVNYDPRARPLRQEWEGFLVENGAFYITGKESLQTSKARLSGRISLYEMADQTYFEIDEAADWLIAEQLKQEQLRAKLYSDVDFNRINLLVCDVDGVLTDAGMYYSNRDDEYKKFNTRDGKGIELLRQAGIQVMFLTAEDVESVRRRAEKLKIEYLFMGVENKKSLLERFFKERPEFKFDQTAFIGDDINDLDCIKASYFTAVPQDGDKTVQSFARYICCAKGGQGCVREICDLIIKGRNQGA